MPGSDGFLQGVSRTAFVDVRCFFRIDIGAVCRIVAGEAVPYPGQGDADETEDDGNSRAKSDDCTSPDSQHRRLSEEDQDSSFTRSSSLYPHCFHSALFV